MQPQARYGSDWQNGYTRTDLHVRNALLLFKLLLTILAATRSSSTATIGRSHAMASGSMTTAKRFKPGKSTTADQVLQGLDLTGA